MTLRYHLCRDSGFLEPAGQADTNKRRVLGVQCVSATFNVCRTSRHLFVPLTLFVGRTKGKFACMIVFEPRADSIERRTTIMSLLLDLPSELEAELATEAAQLGLPLPNYVLGLLATGRRKKMAVQTGAELVAYWQSEGLVGMRPDITDSQAHARAVRDQAERRGRP